MSGGNAVGIRGSRSPDSPPPPPREHTWSIIASVWMNQRPSLARTTTVWRSGFSVTIAIFVFIAAVAISDKTEWYVWLSLGVGLGVIGGVLMGSLAGATMNAHKLDEVDRHTYGA